MCFHRYKDRAANGFNAVRMITAFLAAAILFGPLDPTQRVSFVDGMVNIDVRYRLAQDRRATGEGGPGPSIAAGWLTLTSSGRRRVYDIAEILPIHEHHVILPEDPRGGCGTTQTLTRRAGYAVVESIWAEKGCRPAATFIELATGRIAESVDLDHRWDHRFDVIPAHFTATRLSVNRIERITLSRRDYGGNASTKLVPWNFALVHAGDTRNRPRLLAFELSDRDLDGSPDRGANVLPTNGDDITVGRLRGGSGAYYYPDDRQIRFDRYLDARYAALQPPMSPDRLSVYLHNQWYGIAQDDAEHGSLTSANRALAKAIAYEYKFDPAMYARDLTTLPRCRALADDVHAGRLSFKAALKKWLYGC